MRNEELEREKENPMSRKGGAEVRSRVEPCSGRLTVDYTAGTLYFYVDGTEVMILDLWDGDSYSDEYFDLISAAMPLSGDVPEKALNYMFNQEGRSSVQPYALAMLSRVLADWAETVYRKSIGPGETGPD